MTAPALLAAVGGVVALQLALPHSAEAGVWSAVLTAARVAVLVGAAAALADAGVAMVRGPARPKCAAGCVPPGMQSSAPPAALRSIVGTSTWLRAWHVVAITTALVALLLWRHPGRLVLNEVGFVLTAAPLSWVVARRAGRGASVEAVLALAALALMATFADVRRPLGTVESLPDSPFRWAVGWPADGWVLRHEITLDRPAEARAMTLTAPLTREYAGPARILARVNDHDLGASTINGHTLQVALPAALVAGQTHLRFELRASAPDPNLQIMAFRVTRGATMGAQASSYYDVAAQRWLPGTFNDALGRPQPGIYVVELSVST